MVKFTTGTKEFESKNAAKRFFHEIRDCYSVGDVVGPEGEVHLRGLLALHPKATQMIGCGVSFFTAGYRSGCFEICRNDETRVDWSFLSCISTPTHAATQHQSMRDRGINAMSERNANLEGIAAHCDDMNDDEVRVLLAFCDKIMGDTDAKLPASMGKFWEAVFLISFDNSASVAVAAFEATNACLSSQEAFVAHKKAASES